MISQNLKKMNKVTLFLKGRKGIECLKAVVEKYTAGIIDQVITYPDEGELQDYAPIIKIYCQENKIDCSVKKDSVGIKTKYTIAIGWRWMINISKQKQLIVLHDSILPLKRGFAPLVQSLISGDGIIGVTALFAGDEYDSGPVIRQMTAEIEYPIKINTAIDIMSRLYVNCALSVMGGIQLDSFAPQEQNNYYATYSVWRDEDDYEINWNDSAENIKRFIDAVGYPYKGASTHLKDEGISKIRIFDAEVVSDLSIIDRENHIGKVFRLDGKAKFPVVICGSGLLRITQGLNVYNKTSIIPFTALKRRFV